MIFNISDIFLYLESVDKGRYSFTYSLDIFAWNSLKVFGFLNGSSHRVHLKLDYDKYVS